jgi:hypothetical protein
MDGCEGQHASAPRPRLENRGRCKVSPRISRGLAILRGGGRKPRGDLSEGSSISRIITQIVNGKNAQVAHPRRVRVEAEGDKYRKHELKDLSGSQIKGIGGGPAPGRTGQPDPHRGRCGEGVREVPLGAEVPMHRDNYEERRWKRGGRAGVPKGCVKEM